MSKVNLDTFLTQFYNEYNDLTSRVTDLKLVTDPVEKVKLSQEYEKLQTQTTALQKYLTENTQFIPAYETRKAQEHLAKLAKLAQDKREEVFPKKKFGFKSKQKMASLEDTINVANAKSDESNASKKRDESLATQSDDAFLKNSSCTIRDIDGQTLIKLQTEINGKDIGILNIKNSTIILQGNPSVLHAKNIENCVVLCGPISGSAFVNNLKNVKLVIGCHQLRIHETTDSDFYIHLGSRAIIEHCSTVRFAPYAWTYPELGEHFGQSTLLNANQDNWQCIDDFDWLNQTKESPNWSFMKEEDRLKWTTNSEGKLQE